MNSDGHSQETTALELTQRLSEVERELVNLKQRGQSSWTGRHRRAAGLIAAALGLAGVAAVSVVLADSAPLSGEAVPRQIPYRGNLEQDGVPVTGQVEMTFELFADGTSSAVIWSETRAVMVTNGLFSVDIGDCNPVANCPQGSLATALAASPPSLYLAVKIAGNALEGRQRLLTAPFAARAGYAVHAEDGTPPGAISAFAGTTAPSGWLLCDGRGVSSSTYPRLFAAVGTAWGNGAQGCPNGTTCNFNLPDLRGRFLRGVDQGSLHDPGAAARVAGQTGGNTANAVGSLQAFATAFPTAPFAVSAAGEHVHSYADNSGWSTCNTPANADCTANESGDRSDAARSTAAAGQHAHSIVGGDPETRPTNSYVNWIIKY